MAEEQLAGADLGEQPFLEVLGGELQQRVADGFDRQQVAGQRQPPIAEALLAADRVSVRQTAASELLRPMNSDPPAGAEPARRPSESRHRTASPDGELRLLTRAQRELPRAAICRRREFGFGRLDVSCHQRSPLPSRPMSVTWSIACAAARSDSVSSARKALTAREAGSETLIEADPGPRSRRRAPR